MDIKDPEWTPRSSRQNLLRGFNKLHAQALPKLNKLYFALPYWGDLFQMLRREASRLLGIRVVARSSGTLGNILCSKQKTQLSAANSSGLVHRISCSCGGCYWGETGRELRTRVAEHQAAKDGVRSALSLHKNQCDPGPNFKIAERGEDLETGSPQRFYQLTYLGYGEGEEPVPPVKIVARQPAWGRRKITEGAFIAVAEQSNRNVIRDIANLNRDAGWAPDDSFLPAFNRSIAPLL